MGTEAWIAVGLGGLAAAAGAGVGILYLVRWARTKQRRRKFQDVYPQLRARALTSTAFKLGVHLERGDAAPWGAIMEIGYPQATATLVALRNGDANLYFSNSGALTGGHPAVRDSARQFIVLAGENLGSLSKTKNCPPPDPGKVRFYIRTTVGIYTAEPAERDLAEGSHRLSGLYFGGQNVIKYLRLATQKKPRNA